MAPGSVMPVWGRAGGVVAGSSGATTGAGVLAGVVVVVVVEVEVVCTAASAAWTAPTVVSAATGQQEPDRVFGAIHGQHRESDCFR